MGMLVDYFEAGDRLARVRKSSKWGCQTGNNMHSYFTRIPRHTTVHLKDAVFESLEFTRWDTRGSFLAIRVLDCITAETENDHSLQTLTIQCVPGIVLSFLIIGHLIP